MRLFKKHLCAFLVVAASVSAARAEYFGFSGAGGEKVDGSDILYEETRYPVWCEHTYNARWFPGVAGPKTSTGFYSGPAWSGNYEKGTRDIGYIWSFWGINHPVRAGDSVTPEWWHASMKNVPSVGEGASGKVEGSWPMKTDVWYPSLVRVWRPTDAPADVSKCGQWFKDGVTGEWHHLATFNVPFVADHFTHGSGGFIEDPSNGNRNPHRVDFRNYWFRKAGRWKPGVEFRPSTRQETEKGTAELIENGTAAFFETCSGKDYKGNMGPGAQEVKLTLTMPDKPAFDRPALGEVVAQAVPGGVAVTWKTAPKSSPQFAYKIEIFPTADTSGKPATVVSRIDPDANEALIPYAGNGAPTVRFTLTDVFDQTSAPVVANAVAVTPAPPVANAATMSGLNYAYYEGAWERLPDFSALKPDRSGGVSGVDLTVRRRGTAFACSYSGYIEIPRDGLWAFSLKSSDGSRLTIDDKPLADNDGLHGGGYEVAGVRALVQGRHKVVLDYFKSDPRRTNSRQESLLVLAWEGPGVAKSPVPDSAWRRVPAAGEPKVWNLEMLTASGAFSGLTPDMRPPMPADKVKLLAGVESSGAPVQSVRFYDDATCRGVAYASRRTSSGIDHWEFRTADILGAGVNRLKARVVYGDAGQYTVDSGVIPAIVTQPDIRPWTFSAIGPHAFRSASLVSGDTHTIVGDNLNFDWQLVTGDTTIVARIGRRPNRAWVSQGDGSDFDGDWSGGVLFRNDLKGYPGSEIGAKFVTLLASVRNGIHLQDSTNHNGGGLFWGPDLQNAARSYRWLKLRRKGDVFSAFLSKDGATWTEAGTRDLSKQHFPAAMYVGVYTLARPGVNPNPNRWRFDNVTLGERPVVPAKRSDLVGRWRMDEPGGEGVLDAGPEHLDGLVVNGAKRIAGHSGGGIGLNGVDQCVELPAIAPDSATVTIVGHIRRDGPQKDWAGIAFSRGASSSGLMFGGRDELRFTWDAGNNASYNFSSGLTPPDGKWTFVALVVSPDKAVLYMKPEGGAMKSAVCKGVFGVAPFDAPFLLGRDGDGPDRCFKGAIDDFMVFRRALTPAEIATLAVK